MEFSQNIALEVSDEELATLQQNVKQMSACSIGKDWHRPSDAEEGENF